LEFVVAIIKVHRVSLSAVARPVIIVSSASEPCCEIRQKLAAVIEALEFL